MTNINTLDSGPKEASPENVGKIEKLRQTIESTRAKFLSQGARLNMAGDLPAGAANNICKQECIQINEEYGTLVEARVEEFALSGKVEELEQQFNDLGGNNEAFTKINSETIRRAMDEFYPDKKGRSKLTKKFKYGDRLVTHVLVAKLDTHIMKLRGIQGLRPRQQQFIQNLVTTFENIKAMDSFASGLLKARKEKKEPTNTEKSLKPIGRLALMLTTAGLAFISLITSKGRPSLPFALYAGLTYLLYNGGLPKGKQANLDKQLEFLPDTNEQHAALNQLRPLSETWYIELAKNYKIKGDDWANVTRNMMSQGGRKVIEKMRKALLSKKSSKKEKTKKMDEFIKSFAPDENNATHQLFRKLASSQEDFMKFSYLVMRVSNKEAQHTFMEYMKQGMGPNMWKNLNTGKAKPPQVIG